MNKYLAIIAIVISSTATHAKPLSTDTMARNLAILNYAEHRCSNLRINWALVELGSRQMGLEPKKWVEVLGPEMAASNEKLHQMFDSTEQSMFCAQMEDQFGPGGTVADGFLKRR